MKTKLFLLALAVGLTVPAAVGQSKFATKEQAMKFAQEQVVRHTDKAVATTPSTHFRATFNEPVPAGMARVTLVAGNVWDDGTGYQMLLDADATAYGSVIPETGGLSMYGDVSADVYAEFEYKIPENADGSLYTNNIVIENSVSILVPAGTYDYCITNPTPGDRMWIASDYGMQPGRYDDFVIEAGNEYVFTVSLGEEGYDGVALEVIPAGDVPVVFDPTMPTDLNVEPNRYSAYVTWADEDDAMWNLRYRLYDPEAGTGEEAPSYFWDFEDCAAGMPAGWSTIDADGDGFGWDVWYPSSHGYEPTQAMHGDICLTSASYNYYGALNPDNWLVTPKVALNGTLSLWAAGQDPDYADEVFAVYVSTGNPTQDEFVKISDDITVQGVMNEYTFDLSDYAGQEGYVAIRHYNVSDMFRINIDDVKIGGDAQAPVEAEWIYVDGIQELGYLIEGLEEETMYEVQVQADNGQKTSDWTESFIFTTTGKTGVEEIVVPAQVDNNYYNLMGQKMNPANLPAGIYIHNGKKIMVK
jgi:hypothetical protein